MSEWVKKEIEQLNSQVEDYKDHALLVALDSYIAQLDRRIAQYEHEIDSKMWRPSTW